MVENNTVFVDFAAVVDIAALATSLHPSGKDTALHVARSPWGRTHVLSEEASSLSFVLNFHPHSPWFRRFNSCLGRLHNAGIWSYMLTKAK